MDYWGDWYPGMGMLDTRYPGMGTLDYDPNHGAAYEWDAGYNELYPHWPGNGNYQPFGVIDFDVGNDESYRPTTAPYYLDSVGGAYVNDMHDTFDNARWDMMPNQASIPEQSQWQHHYFPEGQDDPYDWQDQGYTRWVQPVGGYFGTIEPARTHNSRAVGGRSVNLPNGYYFDNDYFGLYEGAVRRGRGRRWTDEL